MIKTISYVSLFRNVDATTKAVSWNASFHVGDVDASASDLPQFDISLFKSRVSKNGVKHLTSKRPLIIEHGDIVPGKKPGKFFTTVASISVPPPADVSALDALLASEDDEQKPAEPANAQPAGETL